MTKKYNVLLFVGKSVICFKCFYCIKTYEQYNKRMSLPSFLVNLKY